MVERVQACGQRNLRACRLAQGPIKRTQRFNVRRKARTGIQRHLRRSQQVCCSRQSRSGRCIRPPKPGFDPADGLLRPSPSRFVTFRTLSPRPSSRPFRPTISFTAERPASCSARQTLLFSLTSSSKRLSRSSRLLLSSTRYGTQTSLWLLSSANTVRLRPRYYIRGETLIYIIQPLQLPTRRSVKAASFTRPSASSLELGMTAACSFTLL